MTIGETIRKALKELSDGILDMMSPKDFRLDDGCCNGKCKPKRARTKDGRFIKDNPDTPHNEAYGEKPNNTKKLIGVLIALLLIAIYVIS